MSIDKKAKRKIKGVYIDCAIRINKVLNRINVESIEKVLDDEHYHIINHNLAIRIVNHIMEGYK